MQTSRILNLDLLKTKFSTCSYVCGGGWVGKSPAVFLQKLNSGHRGYLYSGALFVHCTCINLYCSKFSPVHNGRKMGVPLYPGGALNNIYRYLICLSIEKW